MEFKAFETDRLFIRPTSEEDAAFFFELANTPKWLKYIGDRNIKSVKASKAYIRAKMIPQLTRLGFSSYTLITKEKGHKIGTCGLYDREGLEGIDIGFAFLPAYEKKGFAFEAANRLKIAALEEFGIDAISAITSKDNVASQRLLEKLGLKLMGETTLAEDGEALLLYKIEKESKTL